MQLRVPHHWNVFADGKPGHRFQERYHAQKESDRSLLRKVLHLLLAAVLTAIGVVLVFIPGPAILFFFLAGAVVASDWLWMARTLDWVEVKARKWGKWAARRWRKLPALGRVALLAAGGTLALATSYGAYRLMQ